MESITFTELIVLLEKRDAYGNPVPFSAHIVTCDLERKKGGEILVIDKAVLHSKHKLKLIPSGEIRNFHPLLTTIINGKEVIL